MRESCENNFQVVDRAAANRGQVNCRHRSQSWVGSLLFLRTAHRAQLRRALPPNCSDARRGLASVVLSCRVLQVTNSQAPWPWTWDFL